MQAQAVTTGADPKRSSLKPFNSTNVLWTRFAGYSVLVAALSTATIFAAPSSSRGQALASDPLQAQIVAKNPLPPSAANDPVVARVDGVEIHESDLALAEESLSRGLPTKDENVKRENMIKYLADVIIMSNAAKQRKVADWAYMQHVQRKVEFIRNEALMAKLLMTAARAAVTDEALHKAYEETVVQKSPAETELHVRSIAFRFKDPNDQAAAKTAEIKAAAASKRIRDGEDFAAVARDMSETPGEQISQDMGYVTRTMMGGELADVAFTLDTGGVSGPIKTQIGWFVIKVEDKRVRQPVAFEAVKDSLRTIVARKAQFQLLSELRAQAKIELLDQEKEAHTKSTN